MVHREHHEAVAVAVKNAPASAKKAPAWVALRTRAPRINLGGQRNVGESAPLPPPSKRELRGLANENRCKRTVFAPKDRHTPSKSANRIKVQARAPNGALVVRQKHERFAWRHELGSANGLPRVVAVGELDGSRVASANLKPRAGGEQRERRSLDRLHFVVRRG